LILREAFDYRFSRLDPALAPHIDPPSVALYETLLLKDSGGRPHPMLARSWQVSPDGLEWRIGLRPGLFFHSGRSCDAQAVVDAMKTLRVGDSTEGEIWYWMPVEDVRAQDPETLVFRLRHPYVRLPSLLWGTHTAIYSEATRQASGGGFGCEVADGTGPFRLVSWSPERVVAERWDGYPGSTSNQFGNHGHALLDGVEWLSIPDERDRLEALVRGDVHCLHGPPLGELEQLKADARFEVIEYAQSSGAYLALDWKRHDLGFQDHRTRLAVSLAIDRAALVEEALAGHGWPTRGPLGPGDPYYDPRVDETSGFSSERAGDCLDELGWIPQKDGVRSRGEQRLAFECLVQDDDVMRRLAHALARQLHRLGIELRLTFAAPFADFYAACDRHPASFIGKWLWQDGLDAVIGFTASWGQPGPNWQHSSIPALDRAFEDWLRAHDEVELRATAARAQAVAADELPYIPLLRQADVWVRSRRLHGWQPYSANLYPFYQDVRLEG
jgi:peptide/nickel transport system substrate-binding protein